MSSKKTAGGLSDGEAFQSVTTVSFVPTDVDNLANLSFQRASCFMKISPWSMFSLEELMLCVETRCCRNMRVIGQADILTLFSTATKWCCISSLDKY